MQNEAKGETVEPIPPEPPPVLPRMIFSFAWTQLSSNRVYISGLFSKKSVEAGLGEANHATGENTPSKSE